MNTEIIRSFRYKLEKRLNKLNSTRNNVLFHSLLKQFWIFLHSTPVFVGILDALKNRHASLEGSVGNIIKNSKAILVSTELENAAFSYFVLKSYVDSNSPGWADKIGFIYGDSHNPLEHFKLLFLHTLYDYLDEELDSQHVILSLLRRYKHKCEWFQREFLLNEWTQDTRRGEKKLAKHLYEYLHDQGIEFFIEPCSASGEVDLISAQRGEDRLIADAKIFNPQKSKGKDYIIGGFNQIYQYTLDYNEPFGYMIIYKTCEEDLKFSLLKQDQTTPYLILNNKTIFFVIIDVFHYDATASKRGQLRTIEITENDLVQVVQPQIEDSST